MFGSTRSFAILLVDGVGLSLANVFLILVLNTTLNLPFIIATFCLIITSNIASGAYSQLWRYTSFREVQNLFLSNVFSFCSLLILNSLSVINVQLVELFDFFSIYFLYSLFVRGARRYFSTRNVIIPTSTSTLNVLLLGGGNSASTLIKHILTDKKDIHICGILDNDDKKLGNQIHGIKIIDKLDSLEEKIKELNIKQVIIAMPSAPKNLIRSLTQQLIRLNVSFKVVPHIRDMIDSSMPIQLNNLTLENLIDDKEFTTIKSNLLQKKKKILITGGSGYIGVHLTKMFLDSNYEVVLLDNHLYGSHGISHLKDHQNLSIIHGDISNIKDVVKSLKDVDTIIALAAIVGDPACSVSPQETLNLNYESSKILIETANFYGVRRLVFASSCSVYGIGGDALLTESSALNPVSLYAKTRIMSENILFERSDSVSPVILRLSTVFGYSPRMRFDLVVNLLTAKALVDKKFQIFGGNQWRPFIHCKDVAQAFYLAATKDDAIVDRQIYNVGSSELNYQLKDIGNIIVNHVPDATFDILNDNVDERNYRVDFTKIKTQLGFNPEYNLDNGVIEMVEKIKSSHDLKNYTDKIYSNLETLKSVIKEEV
jgi:nucleoside-diphosphate-sugar epimerase